MRRERTRRLRPLSVLRGRAGHRLRRALATILFLCAAGLAVFDSSTDATSGTPTVVATHELASGTKLRAADVRTVRFPEHLRPRSALDAGADVTGRVLSGAVGQGEPITTSRLVGSQAGTPGTSTVPIRLADPGVARLLEPGIRVDVITLGDEKDSGAVLAHGVTVLAVTRTPSADASGARQADAGPLVLLAASGETGARLAAAALKQPVTVTLR